VFIQNVRHHLVRKIKSKSNFLKWTKIIGIIITAWIIFLVAVELIKELKEGIESFFNNLTNIYTHFYPYIDPNALILIYLVGYAIVWWKQLWGSIIIIIVSIFGYIFSDAGDVRFHFMLTFLVGVLYFVNWNDERKRKNDA